MESQKRVSSIGSDQDLHLSKRFLLDRHYAMEKKHRNATIKLNASMHHPRCRASGMLVEYLRKLDQDRLPSRRRSRLVQLSGSRGMNTEKESLRCTWLELNVLSTRETPCRAWIVEPGAHSIAVPSI